MLLPRSLTAGALTVAAPAAITLPAAAPATKTPSVRWDPVSRAKISAAGTAYRPRTLQVTVLTPSQLNTLARDLLDLVRRPVGRSGPGAAPRNAGGALEATARFAKVRRAR